MEIISAQEVSAQVKRFWDAYCGGSQYALQQMYSPSAIVFGAFNRRGEHAQVTLTRRARKSGNQASVMKAELGPVDIQITSTMAIASYPYHFHLVKSNSDGSRVDLALPYCRATQVFQLDPGHGLRIIHEHFSAAEPGKKVFLPRDTSSTPPVPKTRVPAAQNCFHIPDSGAIPAANLVLPDEVRRKIHNCWQAMENKSKELAESFYFPTAILFAIDARRSELARVAINRRVREFFGPGFSMKAHLDLINVQMTGNSAAIGSYTFQLQIARRLANGDRREQYVPFCRATAVFQREENGEMRILHEHQSAAEDGKAAIST